MLKQQDIKRVLRSFPLSGLKALQSTPDENIIQGQFTTAATKGCLIFHLSQCRINSRARLLKYFNSRSQQDREAVLRFIAAFDADCADLVKGVNYDAVYPDPPYRLTIDELRIAVDQEIAERQEVDESALESALTFEEPYERIASITLGTRSVEMVG